jgi:RNA polymerase sigma-70 factor, ECF subfamily
MHLADPETFSRVYDEHGASVYSTALGILGNRAQAEDVTQDVFLRLWRRPGRFDARRGEVGVLLRVMARSRALDAWREGRSAGRARDRLKLTAERAEARTEDAPERAAAAHGDRRALLAGLRALPAEQREAVVLAYWGGLPATEVARRAGIPLGTAKSRIRLGLQRLRRECAGAVAA